jgi:hypothetical protein
MTDQDSSRRDQESDSTTTSSVLGQKYAFATASLLTGIASYIHLLGMEKAILAIVFAWMALRSAPPPRLQTHRGWARAGLALGGVMLVLVPTVLIIYHDRLADLLVALERLQ